MSESIGSLLERWRISAMRKLQGWAEEERTLHGLAVTLVNTRPDIPSERVFTRLDAALGLIARYQPRRFRRLSRDFSRIHVARYPCRGAFFPDSRVCLSELTFVANADFTPAQIASSIVHESIHARVHAMCKTYDPERRAREERLCRLAELEFGLAIPNGEAVVERARASLELSDDDVAPVIDWNEAARAIATADANRDRGA